MRAAGKEGKSAIWGMMGARMSVQTQREAEIESPYWVQLKVEVVVDQSGREKAARMGLRAEAQVPWAISIAHRRSWEVESEEMIERVEESQESAAEGSG